MKKMSENRVDPTVAGLFLVGLITLFFGLLGVLLWNENAMGADLLVYITGIGAGAANGILVAFALMFVLFAFLAAKVGNAFATALFAFVAVALFSVTIGLIASSFIAFLIIGVFFIVFALVAFLIGAPKLLAILLALTALLYIFVGVFVNAGNNGDDPLTFALLFGVFGILAGAVATYMAVALSTEKLPVF